MTSQQWHRNSRVDLLIIFVHMLHHDSCDRRGWLLLHNKEAGTSWAVTCVSASSHDHSFWSHSRELHTRDSDCCWDTRHKQCDHKKSSRDPPEHSYIHCRWMARDCGQQTFWYRYPLRFYTQKKHKICGEDRKLSSFTNTTEGRNVFSGRWEVEQWFDGDSPLIWGKDLRNILFEIFSEKSPKKESLVHFWSLTHRHRHRQNMIKEFPTYDLFLN